MVILLVAVVVGWYHVVWSDLVTFSVELLPALVLLPPAVLRPADAAGGTGHGHGHGHHSFTFILYFSVSLRQLTSALEFLYGFEIQLYFDLVRR